MRPNRRPGLLLSTLAAVALLVGAGEAQEPSASEGLDFAHRLLKDRRYNLAAQEYEEFLKANPTGPLAADARFGLASARLFDGDYAAARSQFERFLAEFPEHPNALSARFRVVTMREHAEQALRQGLPVRPVV